MTIRFDKPWLSLKEFAAEVGKHPEWVRVSILKKGKVKYSRSTLPEETDKGKPKGASNYAIRRDWADKYHEAHTFGGTAYGKSKAA